MPGLVNRIVIGRRTDSPIFKKKFAEIAKMIPEVINRDIDELCTDFEDEEED